MTTTSRPLPEQRSFLQRHWKKIVGGIVGLVVLVLAASFIYVKFIKEDGSRGLRRAGRTAMR